MAEGGRAVSVWHSKLLLGPPVELAVNWHQFPPPPMEGCSSLSNGAAPCLVADDSAAQVVLLVAEALVDGGSLYVFVVSGLIPVVFALPVNLKELGFRTEISSFLKCSLRVCVSKWQELCLPAHLSGQCFRNLVKSSFSLSEASLNFPPTTPTCKVWWLYWATRLIRLCCLPWSIHGFHSSSLRLWSSAFPNWGSCDKRKNYHLWFQRWGFIHYKYLWALKGIERQVGTWLDQTRQEEKNKMKEKFCICIKYWTADC